MTDSKDTKDIFLRFIGKVKPLKKNNKNFNEPKLTMIKKPNKAKKVKSLKNFTQTPPPSCVVS